ncbi:hypothetical protein D3C75_665320 [compost metagenome]
MPSCESRILALTRTDLPLDWRYSNASRRPSPSALRHVAPRTRRTPALLISYNHLRPLPISFRSANAAPAQGNARRHPPGGEVSIHPAIRPPARNSCAMYKRGSGPQPTTHTGCEGTWLEVFKRIWAAPTVNTPGSVQPGKGAGRS